VEFSGKEIFDLYKKIEWTKKKIFSCPLDNDEMYSYKAILEKTVIKLHRKIENMMTTVLCNALDHAYKNGYHDGFTQGSNPE